MASVDYMLCIDVGSSSIKAAEFSYTPNGEMLMERFAFEEFSTPDSSLQNVIFEGDVASGKENATPQNPYYWCDNGIIYSYDGTDTTIEEVLYGRGNDMLDSISDKYVNITNDPELANVSKIAEKAFMNCPYLRRVDLSNSQNLTSIPPYCFANSENITQIKLPESVNDIETGAFEGLHDDYTVYIYGREVNISPTAFDKEKEPEIHGYYDSAVQRYAKANNIEFIPIDGRCRVRFYDYDFTPIAAGDPPVYVQTVEEHGKVDAPADPHRDGYIFTGWKSDNGSTLKDILEDPTNFIAVYEIDPSSSSSTSTSTSSTGSSSGSSSGSSTGSSTHSSGKI